MAVSRDDHQRFLAIVKDIPDGCGDDVAKANTLSPRFKLRIFVNVHKSKGVSYAQFRVTIIVYIAKTDSIGQNLARRFCDLKNNKYF